MSYMYIRHLCQNIRPWNTGLFHPFWDAAACSYQHSCTIMTWTVICVAEVGKPGVEESSSSSETSPSDTRKPYPSRKSKNKGQMMGKRQVRSSSGYSSHTEETTFR
jgi:hypothetical protein